MRLSQFIDTRLYFVASNDAMDRTVPQFRNCGYFSFEFSYTRVAQVWLVDQVLHLDLRRDLISEDLQFVHSYADS